MGTWKIEIAGTGQHHLGGTQDIPHDAELIAAEFVKTLRERGQFVRAAKFSLTVTNGDTESPMPGKVEDLLAAPPESK